MELLRPKKHSWLRIIISIALVESVWGGFSWFCMTHPKPTNLQTDVVCGLMLAGMFFTVLFGTWWNDIEFTVKKHEDQ